MLVNRREFGGVVAAGLAPAVVTGQRGGATFAPATASASADATWAISMFSKHLPDLHGRDLGQAVREAGFDGIDLTVRGGGHVLPARVTEDLPKRRAGESDIDWAARLNDAGVIARLQGNNKKAVAAFTQAIQARSEYYHRAANNLATAQAAR